MNPTEDTVQRQQYDDAPLLECTITPSKNGRYVIHRTIITHIKPTGYYEAIIRNTAERRNVPLGRQHEVAE